MLKKYYINKYKKGSNIGDPSDVTSSNTTIPDGASDVVGSGKNKIKNFFKNNPDAVSTGMDIAIDASTDLENNILGLERDGVDDLANGAAKIATKFGPWGYLAAGVIKTGNFLSKAGGEKVQGFDGGTGSSGFLDYTMESKQFRSNPLNISSFWTKGASASAYEALVKRLAEEFALAKNIVDDLKLQNEARNNRLQEENMLTQETLNGGSDYNSILAKKGGRLEILKASLGFKLKPKNILPDANFLEKFTIIEENPTVINDDPNDFFEVRANVEDFEDENKDFLSPDSLNKVLNLFNKKTDDVDKFKEGGSLIPTGSLHKNKNHIDNPELKGQITEKGIPVITKEEDGNIIQHAEVEEGEIIFEISITKEIEKLRKEGTNEAAIEAGKIISKEIVKNTTDKTGLIKNTKKDENNNK